jgi:hypothetical protein
MGQAMNDAFDNLGGLRVTSELMAKYPPKQEAKPARRRGLRTGGKFYHVPETWFDRAVVAVGSKDQLVIAVRLFRHWRLRKSGEDTVVASNVALKGWGFSRNKKQRAIHSLELAGLLKVVEQRSGRAPRVTITE